MTHYGLRIAEYRACRACTLCLGTEAGCLGAAVPVTGASADEYDLNVVDCNASVTVARRSSISVSGGLGDPQPPEANVKWFSVASPGLLGIFSFFGGRKKAGVAMLGRLGGRLALGKMARLDPVRLPRQVCRLRARPGAVLLLPLRLTAQPPFRPVSGCRRHAAGPQAAVRC